MRDIINLLSSDVLLSTSLQIPVQVKDAGDSLESFDGYAYDFERLFAIKDKDGNNLLMELAKNMKDDALRESIDQHGHL